MIETGTKGHVEAIVTSDMTARVIGSGELEVLATPKLAAHSFLYPIQNSHKTLAIFGLKVECRGGCIQICRKIPYGNKYFRYKDRETYQKFG